MRFPGQYYDAESGLNYNYFRDYDSATGRYVQSDPIGLNGGLNTYSYAYSSPTSIVDPDGQFAFAIPPAVAAINAIGGAIAIYQAHEATSDKHERDQADSPEKKSERDAYHRRCDETPPSGLSKCELVRWKIRRAKDCIRMRQDYIYKWRDTYPGHQAQIAQRQRELVRLESEEKCCGS